MAVEIVCEDSGKIRLSNFTKHLGGLYSVDINGQVLHLSWAQFFNFSRFRYKSSEIIMNMGLLLPRMSQTAWELNVARPLRGELIDLDEAYKTNDPEFAKKRYLREHGFDPK